MRTTLRLFVLLALLVSAAARAQLAIEITGTGSNRLPVAVAPMAGDSELARQLVAIVRADLERSGLFVNVDAGTTPVADTAAVAYGDWKARGADALVTGSIVPRSDGRFEVRVRVFDTLKQANLGGVAFILTPALTRTVAHRVADFVYEKLLNEKGIFATRIAYVVKQGSRYLLQIADADGQNAQTALISREPIISPAWSPDGSKLAYVSFENKKPIVYVHSLATGKRHIAANFKGSNSAPAWSPDGNRLAVVLTKDGGSQLFSVNADGTGVTRLASSPGIDTEPAYSPDGRTIYFTSDRGGSPQIYRIPATGGEAVRVTFDGSYNVTPRPSPDGRSLAFITRSEGRFQLALMDLASRQVQILTDSAKDESPSFAPNGRMIVIATEIGGRGVLAAVSSDGRIKQRLSATDGDIREPTWGPFSQ